MTAATVFAIGMVGTRTHAAVVAAASLVVLVLASVPTLALPAALLGLALYVRGRFRTRKAVARSHSRDVAELAELISIGLTGGMGIRPALRLAAETLGGPVGDEAGMVLRQMTVGGSVACAGADSATADLYRTIRRSMESGAPLLDPIRRIADELHAGLAATDLEALRRVPVAMLFPLTLLILPGFLLLTVAPALVEAFGRLDL